MTDDHQLSGEPHEKNVDKDESGQTRTQPPLSTIDPTGNGLLAAALRSSILPEEATGLLMPNMAHDSGDFQASDLRESASTPAIDSSRRGENIGALPYPSGNDIHFRHLESGHLLGRPGIDRGGLDAPAAISAFEGHEVPVLFNSSLNSSRLPPCPAPMSVGLPSLEYIQADTNEGDPSRKENRNHNHNGG